jgi:type IV pilus assembly protein PilA
MNCPSCGNENPASSGFCNRCGQPLVPTNAMPAAAAPAPAMAAPPMVPQGEQPNESKAVLSMVFGILSVTIFGFLTGIPAVILGHMSRAAIKRSNGRLKGDGMALTGLITGYISIVLIPLVIVLIVAAIAIPNLLRARIAANEASAVGSVRTLNTAEITYLTKYEHGYGSLEQLSEPAGGCKGEGTAEQACLIDQTLASGQKHGYRFEVTMTQENGEPGYFISAVPTQPGTTGQRSFCSDQTGVIRYETQGGHCDSNSAAIQ